MNKPWQAEYPVSAETARSIIHHQFPELCPANVTILGKGFDNTVFGVNGEYVFRFPRRDIAVPLLSTENRLLPALGPVLPLKIPEPVFFGKPEKSFAFPFTGYRLVKGKLPVNESHQARAVSARKLAYFLRALHDFPEERARALGVLPDSMGRINMQVRKQKLASNIKQLFDAGYTDDAKIAGEYLSHAETVNNNSGNQLVHGDIHVRNVILDEKGMLYGIIDWGDVHLGNAAVDISFIYSYFPPDARKEFFSIYGEIDRETEILARFKSVYTLINLFLYGHDQEDDHLIALARKGLKLSMLD
ncbi:phosphotransferase [Peribacillus sp. B-H-3]|uniref:phosphotransferase n=1 Tax=Peribacillus sp. B-H-3 TaxID=3400420 RepID=UPI003B021797